MREGMWNHIIFLSMLKFFHEVFLLYQVLLNARIFQLILNFHENSFNALFVVFR